MTNHYTDVCEETIKSLRQQLEQAHADIAGLHDQLEEPQIAQDDYRLNKLELEQLRQQLAGWLKANSPGGWIDDLRQQLAAALAACKLKDEALKHIALIDLGRDTLPTDFCMNVLSVRKALAIQPDDSALKAWLGEPAGEVKKHTGSLKDMAIIVWSGEQPAEGTKLYSPKGLK